MLFKNRRDAGHQLAMKLKSLGIREGLVLGLPRGGVVVADEVAKKLHCPLDVIIPRKIGARANPELAIGALAGDQVLLDEEVLLGGVEQGYLKAEIAKQQLEAKRREALYRKGRAPLDVKGKTVIVVDDGIATGATMRVSLKYLKQHGAQHRIGAVPVAPPEAVEKFKREGEKIIALFTPALFSAVGQFYEEFEQTEDSEVIEILKDYHAN